MYSITLKSILNQVQPIHGIHAAGSRPSCLGRHPSSAQVVEFAGK